MEFSIKVKDYQKVIAKYDHLPHHIESHLSTATQKSLRTVQRNTMREAPVNKQKHGGSLRQSIKIGMLAKLKGQVTVGAKYGIFVEEGTRPHIIRVKNRKTLANRRTGEFFGKVVHHPGTKANPFFKRGIKQSQGTINTIFGFEIGQALKKLK